MLALLEGLADGASDGCAVVALLFALLLLLGALVHLVSVHPVAAVIVAAGAVAVWGVVRR